MVDADKGQVSTAAAEVYEELFLPALFSQWAPRVADVLELAPGQRVLDVACGTGVFAREAAARVTPGGSAVGIDINEGMLEIAARNAPEVAWSRAPAEALPFEDGSFDRVASLFGLMFFEDRSRAISEMLRVLQPGGRLVVAVWGSLEETPGYAAVTDLLERLFGSDIADALRAPYNLGRKDVLGALFAEAGAETASIHRVEGTARFPSIEEWMHTDIKGWTLADRIDDSQFQELLRGANADLREFVCEDGTVAFDAPARFVTWDEGE
jgi:SAM-dependent methyltransferase